MAQTDSQSEIPNEQPHRFVLESEAAPGMAKEGLRDLRAAVKQLQQEHPEVVGATVYGSTVKGRATPRSDIDGLLFIDADMLGPNEVRQFDEGYFYISSANINYLYPIDVRLNDYPTSNHRKLEFAEIPISRSIMEQELPLFLEKVDKAVATKRTLPETAVEIVPFDYRGLFHLGIANAKLQPYRRYAVELLSKEGERGEQAWQMLRKALLWYEEGKRKAEINFPETLEEARKRLGIEEESTQQ